jgi:hypothetical protein
MQNDAIHEDVSQEAVEQQERPLSSREQMMEELEAQRLAELRADGVQLDDEQAEVIDPEPAEEKEPEQPATPKEEGRKVLADSDLETVMIRVKVDGQEVELPAKDVVRGYQKDATASRRLEEASQRLREIEAREQAIKQAEQAKATAPTKPQREAVQEAINAMIEGDVDNAAEILESLLAGRQQEAPTPSVDVETVTRQVETALETKTAWKDFAREFPEVVEEGSEARTYGDYLYDTRYAQKVESGEMSYRDALFEIGQKTRAMFAPKEQTPPVRQDAEERKKNLDTPPTVRGKVPTTRADNEPKTQEEMRAQAFEEILKARRR